MSLPEESFRVYPNFFCKFCFDLFFFIVVHCCFLMQIFSIDHFYAKFDWESLCILGMTCTKSTRGMSLWLVLGTPHITINLYLLPLLMTSLVILSSSLPTTAALSCCLPTSSLMQKLLCQFSWQ
jgi:hypothetical protein